MRKPVVVDYSASDWLGGTVLLDPWEELAYRRLCDLIYVHGGSVPDDHQLGALTKTGRRWRKIRDRLVSLGKIEIENGQISQPRCRRELAAAKRRILSASKAGKASADRRREKKTNDLASTPDEPSFNATSTEDPTVLQPTTSHQPYRESITTTESKTAARATVGGGGDLVSRATVIAQQIAEIAGIQPTASKPWIKPHAIVGWLEAGCDPELDILPAVRGVMATRGEPPESVNYFGKAVRRAHQERVAGGNGAGDTSEPIDNSAEAYVRRMQPDTRRLVLTTFRDHDTWAPYYGPRPGEPGCLFAADELKAAGITVK